MAREPGSPACAWYCRSSGIDFRAGGGDGRRRLTATQRAWHLDAEHVFLHRFQGRRRRPGGQHRRTLRRAADRAMFNVYQKPARSSKAWPRRTCRPHPLASSSWRTQQPRSARRQHGQQSRAGVKLFDHLRRRNRQIARQGILKTRVWELSRWRNRYCRRRRHRQAAHRRQRAGDARALRCRHGVMIRQQHRESAERRAAPRGRRIPIRCPEYALLDKGARRIHRSMLTVAPTCWPTASTRRPSTRSYGTGKPRAEWHAASIRLRTEGHPR